MQKIRVLMVCLGNICRSPMAHGVFQARVRAHGLESAIEVDSAGTAGYHVGARPDPRAREEASRRGYDLDQLRARQLEADDFETFDYILTMDEANYRNAQQIQPNGARARLHRFLEFAQDHPEREVPDPYYGGPDGFVHVMDLVEAASDGLLDHICREHALERVS
ncbi:MULTISPECIES: low molecular weight protein-tyrosine-phosphatase [unclassified Thioalkalivibrio]|uniref:low molecular weight protein-tyrosine-phosphatase n=1 Tax=unclassified Thioalkalivibrio TaxID=2621013 RepID=UPI0003810217|nr:MULTISPECIES: low molecular weight protein-tyrosine-phosphatase [unclassified Thioalkalivibrio]